MSNRAEPRDAGGAGRYFPACLLIEWQEETNEKTDGGTI